MIRGLTWTKVDRPRIGVGLIRVARACVSAPNAFGAGGLLATAVGVRAGGLMITLRRNDRLRR
jgi:hypothetical protein